MFLNRCIWGFQSSGMWCCITRQTFDLYIPTANLTTYQKGVYYSGIKIYNHLPTAIKDLSGDKSKFKYSKAQLMYTCFIYYAKCIHD